MYKIFTLYKTCKTGNIMCPVLSAGLKELQLLCSDYIRSVNIFIFVKNRSMKYLFIMVCFVCSVFSQAQQKQDPWKDSQLMDPALLASRIVQQKTKDLVIISVGPEAIIKGSVDIGPTHEPQNLEKLRSYLKGIPKDKEIVIYCGCCPFVKCPNIRPAFGLLMEMGFKNAKLLNLPKNIKTDWLDKDYPTND